MISFNFAVFISREATDKKASFNRISPATFEYTMGNHLGGKRRGIMLTGNVKAFDTIARVPKNAIIWSADSNAHFEHYLAEVCNPPEGISSTTLPMLNQ